MKGYNNTVLRHFPFNFFNLKKLFSLKFRGFLSRKAFNGLGKTKKNTEVLDIKKKELKTLLWLDDQINPIERKMDWLSYSPIGREVKVVWVKNIIDFKTWIQKNGLPDAICFDYDLKDSSTGFDCAKWLVEYCQFNKLLPPLWSSQSTNPDGKVRINRLLKNYITMANHK